MTSFRCKVCGEPFEVPKAAIDKYPNWEPKYCRKHSPQKKKKSGRSRGSSHEEHLTRAQVLSTYHGGPHDGVFTDGSSVPNPGPGGWGVVWVEGGEVREELHGHDPDTTNNRMELRALIEAYRMLPEEAEVVLYTDSRLVVDSINTWAAGWEKKGWKRKGGPIANLELVQELYALDRAHPQCRLEWIASHSGHRWNEYADSLATAWLRDEV